MKHRYIIFDIYDLPYGEELTKDYIIGKANTKREVRKIWIEQGDETDGECNIIIYDKKTKNFILYEEIQ